MTDPPGAFLTAVSRPAPDTVVIAVHEPFLDRSNLDAFTDAVVREATPPVRCVVIDMAQVAFCDSSALSALIRVRNELGATGDRLCLAGLAGQPRALVGITHIDQLIPTFPTTAAAVGSLECGPV
jgi:anti-sigma B factor antagonist